MGQFAGIFFRGNPFLAMTSMVRYHLAKDEDAILLMTERMSQAKSGLAVDELIEVLEDPRFNVRLEAIISMARMRPDPRLTQALTKILDGTELALTGMAAWALGRLGDQDAIVPLRTKLDSDYRSIRVQSIRALGKLDDRASINLFLKQLETEDDKGLQIAFAAALGNMRVTEATPFLLEKLIDTQNEGARLELGLALARIIGQEHKYIQSVREIKGDMGTATARAIAEFKKQTDHAHVVSDELDQVIKACVTSLSHNQLDLGIGHLTQIISLLPMKRFSKAGNQILQSSVKQLEVNGPKRIEAIILLLHVLQVDWK